MELTGSAFAAVSRGARTVVAVAVLCLCLPSLAQAAYEQLPGTEGIFGGMAAPTPEGNFPEEVQLGGVGALAVNRTGAGGVPKGTVYAVTRGPESVGSGDSPRVAMFEPTTTGGGLQFAEGWQVTELEEPYERCGPLVGTKKVNGEDVTEHPCPRRSSQGAASKGIAVDQSTGDVYVYAGFELALEYRSGIDQVIAYTPDGDKVTTRFGEQASPSQTVAESPGKTHDVYSTAVLAVNASGEAYVADELKSGEVYHRVMVFRPHEGDFRNYEYAGEVDGGTNEEREPHQPVVDDAGHLYVAGSQGAGDHIEALADETPGPYPNVAMPTRCEYHVPKGGLSSLTVDPTTGEPFFFSNRAPVRIRRLGPCNEATHEFAGAATPEAIELSPQPEDLHAMTVDPERQAQEARPSGELLAAASEVALAEFASHEHSALGYIFSHPLQLEPKIEAESIDHVTASEAVAHASIDPNGFRTNYVFQYETAAEYEADGDSFAGAKEDPVDGSYIEGAGGIHSVSASLEPLLPATAYRYRVLVTNECKGAGQPLCVVEGETAEFQTYAPLTAALPDGRAWELVSPVQKDGGQVLPRNPEVNSCPKLELACKPGSTLAHFPMQSAPDGEAVVYEGMNFGLGGSSVENEYLARRTPSGWQNTDLAPAVLQKGRGYKGLTPTLGQAVVEQGPEGTEEAPLAADAPAGYANLYLQPSDDPSALAPLLNAAPPHRGSSEFTIGFAAASADGQHVFLTANDALSGATADAPAAIDGGAGKSNLYEWHGGQLALVNVAPGNTETQPGASFATASANPVSADGSHAFWSDEAGQVYVRIDGTETRRIEDPGHGRFLSASTDGAKVLLSDGCVYEVSAGACTADLSEGKAGFEGVLGQSDDLSHVYFVDSEALDSSPNSRGEVAEAGAHNLYAWRVGGAARFVARLATSDNAGGESYGIAPADWATIPADRTAEASPDGRYVAFASTQALTGRDSVGPCQEISGTGVLIEVPCPEAFVYDSETDDLTCASCNPSGAAPLGWTVLARIAGAPFAPQPRYLTDSGRLYFDSRDSLSPLDTNEGAEDVYQYEPDGIGSCEQEGGCVALISSGREGADSNFVAADETGKNVFFTTRDRLVVADKDEAIDLYDVRESGGIVAEAERVGGECQGETCQPAILTPSESTPGSSVFSGPGNLVSPLTGAMEPKKTTTVKTRAQKLAAAMKACHRLAKTKRKHCEALARKRYGSKSTAKSKKSNKGGK